MPERKSGRFTVGWTPSLPSKEAASAAEGVGTLRLPMVQNEGPISMTSARKM